MYPNLRAHDPDYPTPAYLKSTIRWGNVDFPGEMSKDTPGSNLIKSLLLDDRPGPLYVTADGGQSTIARAPKSIHDEYVNTPQWNAIRDKVSRKLVILPSGDQDGIGASYIRPNWPQVVEWRFATTVNWGYGVRNSLPPQDWVYVGTAWMKANVTSRGPLGALYRVWGDGKQMAPGDMTDYFGLSGFTAAQLKAKGYYVWTPPQEKGSYIGEGDDPVFMNFPANGLRGEAANGSYGGWGGRAVPNPLAPRPPRRAGGRGRRLPPAVAALNARFFVAAQNDFAARMQWSVTPDFSGANHDPVVKIVGPLNISAAAGSTVHLQGQVSDPDGNAVGVGWWQYPDAGVNPYPGTIQLSSAHSLETSFQVPADAKPGQTIHVVLQGTDDGLPPLTRYQRVVVTVRGGRAVGTVGQAGTEGREIHPVAARPRPAARRGPVWAGAIGVPGPDERQAGRVA